MEHSPVVSVCIANYNGETLLNDCIDSVLAQGLGDELELLVHDDASTDASIALIRDAYPKVRIIESKENVGFCIANNRMARIAKGRFLLLLNNDAALMPNAISTLLAEQANVGTSCILTLPQYDWESGELVDRGCLLDPFYNPIPNLDPLRHEVAYAIGACLWIEKLLWDELGGFPAWMGSIGEDLYLCGVARLQGIKVYACPTSNGFRHRLGSSFGGAKVKNGEVSSTLRRRQLSEQNKARALIILTPSLFVWPLLILHIATLILEGAVLSIVTRSWACFRRIYLPVPFSLASQAKQLTALRKSAQSSRSISFTKYFSVFSGMPRKLVLFYKHGIPRIDGL